MPSPSKRGQGSEGLTPDWKLPRGPHGIPSDVVADHQRRRLLAAVAVAMAEYGYGELTVARVIAAAGVSRKTFYEYFANKQEAVLAAHEDVCARFIALMVKVCTGEGDWPLKIRAAIHTVVDFAVAEPAQAQLLTVDALSSNVDMARQVLDIGDHLAGLLRRGREQTPRGPELPDLTEKALVGMVSAIVASRLINDEAEMLATLEPQLVELTLIPYIGTEEATRVAGRTV